MKVLIVFSSSELGGAERSLTRMALSAMTEVSFSLATLDGQGPWVEWSLSQGLQPVVLGNRDTRHRHGRFGISALWNLVGLVRRERYKAIYVIGFRASLCLRLMRPLLAGAYLVHGIRWNPESCSRLDKTLRATERILGFLVDCYICNSKVAAKTLSHRAGVPVEKLSVIYNGLDWLSQRDAQRSSDAPNVIVLANLSPRKGHAEFLDVVQAVCKQIPAAHFFFVGRDDMHGELASEILRRGIEGQITLTGYQPEVAPWLNKARLMVLPSKWGEGCPTSVLEGFAHNLPVVAYRIDGIPELISDGIDGILVSPGDSAGLESAILKLLKATQLAAEMGAKGRAKVEERFTLSHCAREHAKAFSHLSMLRRKNNF
jgi:glycosyltransferase involved in cell wall biosynthesis